MTKKTRIITLAALVVLASAALYLNFMPRRAPVNDEAINAANDLVAQHGGGEQPKNAEGVPLDAVVDPAHTPGTRTFGK